MTDLPHLLRPLALGPAVLANRIVSTAHQTNLIAGHVPTDDFVAYHAARAAGGAGLIILEAAAVDPSGLLTAKTLSCYLPESAAGLRRVAEAVRPAGTRLFVQLFHGGREQIAVPPLSPALAPSAVPSPRFHVEPRALTGHEIEQLIEAFARAARTAADAGLDGVEISAAHRYLVASFFVPELNRRDDEWASGPHLLTTLVGAVRDAAPDIAVGLRVSADAPEGEAIAAAAGTSVDFLHLCLGDASTLRGAVGIVPPPPVTDARIAGLSRRFPQAVPRIVTGRILDPLRAEALIAAGDADAVGMTRALITDPDLPAKLRAGRADDVVRCIGCNACIAHYHAGTPLACTQNPRTGRERRLARPVPEPARRVTIVGAGPAGLAAAAEALARGHRVVLFEQASAVGGQLRLYADAPGQQELSRSLLHNYKWLEHAPDLTLRLGARATADAVGETEPDLIVLACGAEPYVPPLDLGDVDALQAWDVLGGARPAGRVLVADWGGDPSGLDSAEVLAAAGAEVTLAVAAWGAGEGLHHYRRSHYLGRLYGAGVEVLHHVELAGAGPEGVRLRNIYEPAVETVRAVDAVVIAHGRVPAEAPDVDGLGVPVRRVGDHAGPRSLEEAVLEGTTVVVHGAGRARPSITTAGAAS